MLGGYPRSAPDEPSISITDDGGGSHGVPIEKSINPPSKRSASGLKRSIRS